MSATNDEADKQLLDFLQFHLEREVSNWAIDATEDLFDEDNDETCLLYTSPSPRDATLSRMPSSA